MAKEYEDIPEEDLEDLPEEMIKHLTKSIRREKRSTRNLRSRERHLDDDEYRPRKPRQ